LDKNVGLNVGPINKNVGVSVEFTQITFVRVSLGTRNVPLFTGIAKLISNNIYALFFSL